MSRQSFRAAAAILGFRLVRHKGDHDDRQEKSEELNEKDLDEVQGAGIKGPLGDDLGILRGGIQKPDPKQMERVFEDE
jgi:hypothetical protein